MKLFLKLLTALFFMGNVTAQTNCKNGVSTNYLSATNLNLPNGSSTFLNGFNWYPTVVSGSNSVIPDDYSVDNMIVSGIPITSLKNIAYNSLVPYYSYLEDGPIPVSENGWELLFVNLGRYPDDTTLLNGSWNDKLPYIVLYNKYKGKVRVFVNFGTDFNSSGPDAIEVVLEFKSAGGVSGLLNLGQGDSSPLSDSSATTRLVSVAKANTYSNQWSSTDFQVTYDPCTCFNMSELVLSFNLISTSTVKLESRLVSFTEELTTAGLQVVQDDFLSGFDYTDTSATGGLIMYKQLSEAIDNHIAKLTKHKSDLAAVNEHNAKVKANLIILKGAKFIIGAALTAGTAGSGAVGLGAILKIIDASDTNAVNIWNDLQGLQSGIAGITAAGAKFINTEKIFAATKLVLGKTGSTFIANNFEPKTKPEKPPTPTVALTVGHYSGKITSSLQKGGFDFYTPGTYGSTGTGSPSGLQAENYPVYNEVLGVFSLLESPKIKISEQHTEKENRLFQSSEQNGSSPLFSGDSYFRIQRYQSSERQYQIQLAEDLKYALNDVLDIKSCNVNASFDIVAKLKSLTVPNDMRIHAFLEPDKNVNIESTNTDIQSDDPLLNGGKPHEFYLTNYNYPYDNLGPVPFDPASNELYTVDSLKYYKDTVYYQTPVVPINAFKQVVSGIGLKNEFIRNHKNYITPSQIASGNFPHTFTGPCNNCVDFDLPNSDLDGFVPPTEATDGMGYEYDFDVVLKLFVDVEFHTLNSDGITHKLSLLLSYPVNMEDDVVMVNNGTIIPNLSSSSSLNFGQFSQDQSFSTTHFAGQPVQGCSESAGHYECRAWNDITIIGDITTGNGYSVEFIAGNQIDVFPASNISPEVILRIEPYLDFSHPMPKADSLVVHNFCHDNSPKGYKANIPRSEMLVDSLTDAVEENSYENDFLIDFTLYPNPNNLDMVSLQLTRGSDAEGLIQIVMHDIMGRLIEVQSQSTAAGIYTIDITNLAPGIYFVTGSTFGNEVTKRLIVH